MITIETWRPCPRYPDYQVSSGGRVRRRIKRGCSFTRGRALKQRVRPKSGYPYVQLPLKPGWSKSENVHPLVCEAFHGPRPSAAHCVAHNDGSRTNNAASNLRWATPAENSADMFKHGTVLTGEKNGNSKLSEDQVRLIKQMSGSASLVGALFGVSESTIRQIRQGRIWTHVQLISHEVV